RGRDREEDQGEARHRGQGGPARRAAGRLLSTVSFLAEPPHSGAAAHDAEPDPYEVARTMALRSLDAAPRSRHQLGDRLVRKGVAPEVAERVLDRFTEVGLLDDAAYARMLVSSRRASPGLPPRALALELRRARRDCGGRTCRPCRRAARDGRGDRGAPRAQALARDARARARGRPSPTRGNARAQGLQSLARCACRTRHTAY